MVSFTSIAQGITLISILIMRSEAAPAAGSVNLTPTNTTLASLNKLAPIISDRVVLVTHPEVTADINSEAKIIAENKEIFVSNGGNLTNLERREITNIASTGLTYTVPASAPAAKFLVGDTVTAATTAQITAFRLYSAVASSTYCDSVTISGKWTCTYCKEYVPDAEVIVAYEAAKYKIGGVLLRSDAQKTIFVVFRGSYNIPNWLADFDFIKIKYDPVPGVLVHQGFYNAYKEASTYYFPQFLEQHKLYPNYKVVVTGHSLGAAEAVLSAMDLYQRVATLTKDNLSLYTGGCPRVGDDKFAYYVDSTKIPNYRSVHNRDIVPHVPPQDLGFDHPGIEVWSRDDNSGQLCSGIENSQCSNSIVPFTNFKDHNLYYGIIGGRCT